MTSSRLSAVDTAVKAVSMPQTSDDNYCEPFESKLIVSHERVLDERLTT